MQLKQPGLTVAHPRNVKEDNISELAPATYKNYIKGRKDSPTPTTVRKAVNQVNGVRSAKEKIHDKEVDAKLKSKGDPRLAESVEPLRKRKLKESYTDFLHNVLDELLEQKKK